MDVLRCVEGFLGVLSSHGRVDGCAKGVLSGCECADQGLCWSAVVVECVEVRRWYGEDGFVLVWLRCGLGA